MKTLIQVHHLLLQRLISQSSRLQFICKTDCILIQKFKIIRFYEKYTSDKRCNMVSDKLHQ